MRQLMMAAAVQYANRFLLGTVSDSTWDKTVARVIQENDVTFDIKADRESINDVDIGVGRFGTQCPRFSTAAKRLTVTGSPFALYSDFTIEGHFYFEDIEASTNQYMMDYGTNGFILRYYGGGIAVYNGGGVIIQSGIKPQNNRWYHVAVVRYNQTLTLYIDGVSVGSAVFTTGLAYTSYTLGNYGGGGYAVRARIDQFRVVQEALYTGTFTVPAAPFPVGGQEATYDPYWSNTVALLDSANGSTLLDSTGKYTVENVGGASIISSGVKIGAAAVQFTAADQYLRIQDSLNEFDFGTVNWTVEAWVKPSAKPTGVLYLIGRGTAAAMGGWSLVLNNMRPQLRWSTTGTSWNKVTPLDNDTALEIGRWYHIAIARLGDTFQLFINGRLHYSVAVADTLAASTLPVTIGNGEGGTAQFLGVMDSIRITRGISRYHSEFTPKLKTRYASNGNVIPSSNDPYWPRVVGLLEYISDIGAGPDQFSVVLKRTGAVIDPATPLFGKPSMRVTSGSGGGLNYSNGSKTTLGSLDNTVEGWVNTDYTGGTVALPIIGQYHATATGAWVLGVYAGKALFFIRGGNTLQGTKNINDGQWHHVAVSIRSGVMYMYVDGVLEAQTSWGVAPTYNGNIQVGYNISVEAPAGFRINVGRVRITKGRGRYTSNFVVGEDTVQLSSLAA